MNVWSARIVQVPLDECYPPHEEREPMKLALLKGSLMGGGWSGRPLLGFRHSEGGIHLLTGTHRVLAAVDAGLRTVPVVILDAADDALDRLEELLNDCDDRDVLRWLRANTYDAAAIALMEAEVQSNANPWQF